jgi:hypothetical protein
VAATEVLEASKNGFPWRASIGARIEKAVFVEEGETAEANGQTFEGPLTIVRSPVLHEISFVGIAADDTTSVSIAAKQKKEAPTMPDSITALREREAAETKRISDIRTVCAGSHSDLEATAITEGWDATKIELAVLRAERATVPAAAGVQLAIHTASRGVSDRVQLTAAFLAKAGFEDSADPVAMERAKHLRGLSMVDLCRAAVAMERPFVPADRNEMIRAAFSTISLPTALGDTANRVAMKTYNEAPATWQSFAAVRDAKDFRTHTSIRHSFVGELDQLGPDGEIKEDATYPWKVDTYAKQFGITRQDLINDDTSILDDLVPSMSKAARRKLSDLVWSLIFANGGNFFHANNANLLTGAGSALQISALENAVTLIRSQRDAQNNDLDIQPRTLVVGNDDEITARQILESLEVNRTGDNSPTGNALRRIVNLEVESRITNTTKFASTAATNWYVFSSPMDAAVIVGFLGGQRTPVTEFFGLDHDPNTLGVKYRIYHDFGAALGDPKAAVKSDGA